MQKYIFLLELSSHVMPTPACAMTGIYGCCIQESVHLNIKTRNFVSGCGRGVPLGLGLGALSSSASRRRRWVSMPRCQCSHSFRLKSFFLLFFLLFLQVFVFLPSSIAKQRCVFIGNNIALVLYSECPRISQLQQTLYNE